MSDRTDFAAMAEKIDYPKLEKKLEQLRQQEPPKKRKGIADVLAPVREKLIELHAAGWTYPRLVEEPIGELGIPATDALAARPSVSERDAATDEAPGAARIRYIQQLLGHESLETTAIYTEVNIRQLQEVHARTHPAAKLPTSSGLPSAPGATSLPA